MIQEIADALAQSWYTFATAFVLFVPRLVAATIIIAGGFVVAVLARRIVLALLGWLRFDRLALRTGASEMLRVAEMPSAELLVGLDLHQLGDEGVEVEGVLQRRLDELVLGVEDPEDRPLCHARRVRDLLGRHCAPVLEEQRDGRIDEGGATLVGRERLGTGWHADQRK